MIEFLGGLFAGIIVTLALLYVYPGNRGGGAA